MTRFVGIFGLAFATAATGGHARAQSTRSPDSAAALAKRVLRTTPLIDGHNDLPWRIREDSVHPMDVNAYNLRQHAPGQTDLERPTGGDGGRPVLVGLHPW